MNTIAPHLYAAVQDAMRQGNEQEALDLLQTIVGAMRNGQEYERSLDRLIELLPNSPQMRSLLDEYFAREKS